MRKGTCGLWSASAEMARPPNWSIGLRRGLPLTLLPGGNENLLARHLHLDPEPEKLAETIARGKILRLDAGRAGERIFLLMAGCGLDAEVVRLVHERRTGHIRSRDYLKPLWEVLRTYDYPELRVYCDETAAEARASPPVELSLAMARGVQFALLRRRAANRAACRRERRPIGSLRISPAVRSLGSLALVAAVYLRQHRRLGDWTTRKIRRVRIESDAPVPYQLDGDPGGMLPLEIEVLPKRLTLIVP